MSYILDALKKAERERGMTKIPTLSTVHDSGGKPSHRFLFLSIGGLVLLVSGLVFILFLWNHDDQTATGSPEYPKQPPASAMQASGGVEFPVPEIASSSSPSPQSSRDLPVSPEASPSKPARSGPTIAGVSSADSATISSFPAAESQSGTPSQQEPQQQVLRKDAVPSRTDGSPRGASASSRETSQIETRSRESGIASQESSLHQAMKDMNISILFYAENPSDRMVFINGRKYVEGDYVDGRFLLERITANGAVLNHQGEQAILKPKSD